jgi:hypothetical protein
VHYYSQVQFSFCCIFLSIEQTLRKSKKEDNLTVVSEGGGGSGLACKKGERRREAVTVTFREARDRKEPRA